MSTPRTAVVTLAHGRHDHLRAQHASLLAGSTLPAAYVVVAMGDQELMSWRPAPLTPTTVWCPTTDAGLPLAQARNLGVRAALAAGADTLVLLDADCVAGRDLVAGYAADVAARPDAVWCGPVTYLPAGASVDDPVDRPHPARPAPAPGGHETGGDWRLFWSLSFALSARAWTATGGFCERYVGYGGEDTDFGQLAARAGLTLGWTGTPRAYHQHHPPAPAPDRAADVVRNAGVFHDRWGWWPMEGWLARLAADGLAEETPDGWRLVGAGA